jgi:hypothetical protein
MSADHRTTIVTLHALYGQITGMSIRLDMARESQWFEFIRRGHGEQELRDVVAHLRRGIRAGERRDACLKFSNLVGQVDYFEEDLALARAKARGRTFAVHGDKAAVLRATGRDTRINDRGPRAVGQILQTPSNSDEAKRAFEIFRKLKDQL